MRDNDSDNDEDYSNDKNWSNEEESIAKAFKKLRCLFKNNEDQDESFEIKY